jgi:hypothetical protein
MSDSEQELVITETVAKPSKKPRTPAQAAATQKAFAAMKARREELSKAPSKEQKKKSEPAPPDAPKTEAPPPPAPAMPPTPPANATPNDITEFAKQIILALRPVGPAEPIKMSRARKPKREAPAKPINQPTAHEEAPSPRHVGIRGEQRGHEEPLVAMVQASSRDLLMNKFKKPATAKGLTGTELLDKLFFSR